MSLYPTPIDVVKNALALKWRDTLIGAMAFLLVACMSWIGSDLVSSRDKLKSIPDPAQIATYSVMEQRFKDQDRKIDTNIATTQDSLRRIEGKVDTLLMSMATRRRTTPIEQESGSTGVPMTRVVPSGGMSFTAKKSNASNLSGSEPSSTAVE